MRLIKVVFFTLLTFICLNAKELTPSFVYTAKGGVTDMVVKDKLLYVATSASSIDIFDIKKQSRLNSIELPKIKDFMGDIIDSKVYSLDVLDKEILILSQGEKGARKINISKDDKLTEIISDKEKMFIAKAKFINKHKIIFALLSNEIYTYDIKTKKILKKIQVSHSKFSNFVLTEDKKNIIVADESGDLKMYNTDTLNLIKTFEKQNLDNVFQVDSKNGLILTAGQDRKSVVYSIDGKTTYSKDGTFLIYSVGLSPSGKLAGFASNEDNDITVFNTDNRNDLHTLVKNPATITNILFINEKEVFVSSDHKKINYYKIY